MNSEDAREILNRARSKSAAAADQARLGRDQGRAAFVANARARTETKYRDVLASHGATLTGTYVDVTTRVNVRCSAGHDIEPLPRDVMSGRNLCPVCPPRPNVFYVVSGSNALKLGVTSGRYTSRLSAHARDGFPTAELLLTDLPGYLAMVIESTALHRLHMAGYRPVRGREYFPADALPEILSVAAAQVAIS